MKLSWVKIRNYRACKEIEFQVNSMHALVGANNSGKTSILKALDFLFNPSVSKLDDECFWNKDTSQTIWVEAIFNNLTTEELIDLSAYLTSDNTFHIARSAKYENNGDAEVPEEDNKIKISQHYCSPMPRLEWLRDSEINSANIERWCANSDNLTVHGISFAEFLGSKKPKVGDWKTKAKEFITLHLTKSDYEDVWNDNPKGYANVLKGILPSLIYIPAVRDLEDETKVTKTNPFGKLLFRILETISEERMNQIIAHLDNVRKALNKDGGEERIGSIVETEEKLNSILNDYMSAEIEIEFETPNLEILMSSPKLYINDGFRNIAQNKGHGLQRAVIFSILQLYSELLTERDNQRFKSSIFAIEEPEIYMHPQAQRNLRKVLLKISSGIDQVLFATHSFLLLDVASFDEIIRLQTKKTNADGLSFVETKIYQLPIEKLVRDLISRHPKLAKSITYESIRELYSHAYHPSRSEGFFASKIILVEGATEQYSLPVYAEALGINLDMQNVSIVDSGGKGSIDRLYRIFNELGIPCFMLIDYDNGSNDGKIIAKSKELLAMVGEEQGPNDHVTVYDKIAYFPSNWEADLMKEIPNYDAIVVEAKQVLGGDVGKPLIARFVARKLTKQNVPFIPPSIQHILEKAVNVTWESSCLVV